MQKKAFYRWLLAVWKHKKANFQTPTWIQKVNRIRSGDIFSLIRYFDNLWTLFALPALVVAWATQHLYCNFFTATSIQNVMLFVLCSCGADMNWSDHDWWTPSWASNRIIKTYWNIHATFILSISLQFKTSNHSSVHYPSPPVPLELRPLMQLFKFKTNFSNDDLIKFTKTKIAY